MKAAPASHKRFEFRSFEFGACLVFGACYLGFPALPASACYLGFRPDPRLSAN
jgi:hypothetical protein